MFSLNDSMRYLLYNRPTDMRKSFHTLSGIITDAMGQDPCSGNVYIFINRARDRIKLLHWEPGGMVLYSKLLEAGTLEGACDLSFSIVVFLLKSSTESLLYISLDVTKLNAFNILVLPALLCPIMTLIPSWKSTVVLSKFLNPLIVMFEIYIE